MKLVFESERLRFRPLEETDLDLVVQQWTDPEVAKYAGGKTSTEEELARGMSLYTRRCARGCIGNWCLIDKATNEKLGTANLLPMPVDLPDTDWDLVAGDEVPEGVIEIGYILKRSAWGRGYATEACSRMLKFAFEETPLEELIAATDAGNIASQRVLGKCGFTSVGAIQNYGERTPGFRLTKEDWSRLNAAT